MLSLLHNLSKYKAPEVFVAEFINKYKGKYYNFLILVDAQFREKYKIKRESKIKKKKKKVITSGSLRWRSLPRQKMMFPWCACCHMQFAYVEPVILGCCIHMQNYSFSPEW